jgi:hypothetical protein
LGLLTTTVSTVTFLQLDGDLLSELMMIELQPRGEDTTSMLEIGIFKWNQHGGERETGGS